MRNGYKIRDELFGVERECCSNKKISYTTLLQLIFFPSAESHPVWIDFPELVYMNCPNLWQLDLYAIQPASTRVTPCQPIPTCSNPFHLVSIRSYLSQSLLAWLKIYSKLIKTYPKLFRLDPLWRFQTVWTCPNLFRLPLNCVVGRFSKNRPANL